MRVRFFLIVPVKMLLAGQTSFLVAFGLTEVLASPAHLEHGYGRGYGHGHGSICVVEPCPDGGDSAPAIIEAFERCGHNPVDQRGRVIFQNSTYTVKSVMNTTYLSNVDVDLQGTLSWDNADIYYWLNNSLPVGLQNQSSAWLFGGANVNFQGHGYGTLNGNGQAWYDFNNGTSNYPRRPHAITIRNTTNSVIEGLRFLNSQMWTMTVISSENVTLQDIYVNNTSTNGASAENTDGADTAYANNITFRRWTVDNGDDGIACKDNSTNILIEDSVLYNGQGIAMGSIGQYEGIVSTIQNVTARNITLYDTRYAAYVKTWTGVAKGYPPNGGGGGLGFASGLLFENMTVSNKGPPIAFEQCTNYEGGSGDCDTSKFNIHDVTVRNIQGTVQTDVVATLQCSAASPCTNITFTDLNLRDTVNGTAPAQYLCDSVQGTMGFNCTGPIVGENNGT